jgi:hypothetical protein
MRPIIPRTELTPIASLPSLYNPRDLALIRRTVALDTTDDEFALFIHWARSLRLDPLRRQVHAFVFHKNDPKKRRLSRSSPPSRVFAPSPPAQAITASTKMSPVSLPMTQSKPRPIRPASSAVPSGSGNTRTGNGSPSQASPAGTNLRRSRRCRPTARSSTSPAAGGYALLDARQMR